MFDYLAMSYEDSDYYTVVITLMCWHKHMFFGGEIHIDDEFTSTFVFPSTAIAQASCFVICLQYSPRESPTKILTTLLWLPWCTEAYMPKTHPGGEVVSAVITPVFLLATIAS